jgi:hypothetical protein
MDTSQRWGLPEGFAPVRYPIPDAVKDVVRGVLAPGEPVVVTLANEGGTISVIATPQRLITVKSGATGAGVTGFNTKEFPWEAITNLIFVPVSINCKFSICYKSTGGGKVETGLRAKMGKDAKDDVMPFENAAGEEAFQAIYAIWHHKMMQLQQAAL